MKKYYLYLDTTKTLRIGLLDDTYSFQSIEHFDQSKSASIIHQEIYQILRGANIELKEVQAVIINNGPGSYTGVRVAEGLLKVLELDGLTGYSFYEFEMLKLTFNKGLWISNAFKGEYFIYHWEDEVIKFEGLVAKEEFSLDKFPKIPVYSNESFEGKFGEQDSKNILEKNATKIFSRVIEAKMRREPFYFRKIEQEFKVPK